MESVEWIFTDYKAHCSMLRFLQEELAQLTNGQNAAATDEDISGMVLARPLLDGMPHRHSSGSSTEWAVIRLNDENHNRESIISEFLRYRRILRIHEAALRILTVNELWFVENHYYEEHSLASLPQLPDSPFSGQSRSTMSNFKKRLLSKVERFLNQTAIPSE